MHRITTVDMGAEVFGVKIGLLSGLVYALLSTVIGDAAAEIVAVVAALTALGWLWKKMVVPAAKAFQRTYHAVDALEELPRFMNETRGRLTAVENQVKQFNGEGDSPRHALHRQESPR